MARAPVRVTFIRTAAEFMNETRGEDTPTGAEDTPTGAGDASGGIPPRCASERMKMRKMMITHCRNAPIHKSAWVQTEPVIVITSYYLLINIVHLGSAHEMCEKQNQSVCALY